MKSQAYKIIKNTSNRAYAELSKEHIDTCYAHDLCEIIYLVSDALDDLENVKVGSFENIMVSLNQKWGKKYSPIDY